ncbi:tRNA (guanine-N(7)-)-methyltransferase non-catalytic subunit wuho [Tribolium madens]|uniref:tRNA (guanine-N(7)-)-methyltransferase non-catalytic subunit wuho n=1 Tax=Tribolium madens TaxID=41895 RepID=UPI001CF72065|nr:tRNA (guanine-N(7)-)-methyltransferase non-catalytic subunit wuho [Tribolium madens]
MNIKELNSRLVLTSGDTIVALDTTSGTTQTVTIPAPNLPPNLTKGQLEVLNKQDRTISSLATSQTGQYIVVSTENKQIVLFDNNLNLIRNFIVNRAASKVLFTNQDDILVADRTGDVFLYKFNDEKTEPTLLLGHLSMILDMKLSECGKYIVTCDRDEKIRVSHFPNTYNIVSFCLGHEEFVTRIDFVKHVLVSASGDGTLRVWDYLKGEQLSVINTNNHVDDANLLKDLSLEMDKEKVDVSALPIIDMQTFCSDGVFIAVSLLNYKSIQLYKLSLDNHVCTYVKSIQCDETPLKFHLSTNLFIFDNSKLTIYDYCSDSSRTEPKPALKIADCHNFITVLYKRKYDNVQEYLERKKLRLESNK